MNASWCVALGIGFVLPSSGICQGIPEAQVELNWRIGGVDAPSYAAFSREPDAILGPNETTLLRISSPPGIEVLDESGHLIRTIGREGEGPGEFTIASRFGLVGDSLWVINFPEPRVSWFLLDGVHLRTERLDVIDRGRPFAAPQSITAFLEGPFALALPNAPPIGADDRVSVAVLHGDREFERFAPVITVDQPQGMFIPGLGSFAFSPVPRSPLVAVAPDGRGFATAEWDDVPDQGATVSFYEASGEQRWSRTIRLDRHRIPSTVRDSLIASGVEMARPHMERPRGGETLSGASMESLVSEGLDLPDHHPPIDRLVLGGDGTMWLRRTDPGASALWVVLDSQGSAIFEVNLPWSFNLRDASRARLVGTEIDELGVPYVSRYSVAYR